MQIKVLGIKMPKKKRKSSLGRLTANAKYKQKTRLNEDEKTYSQRTEIEKERQGAPQHILNLKVGCVVMLLRNLNPP